MSFKSFLTVSLEGENAVASQVGLDFDPIFNLSSAVVSKIIFLIRVPRQTTQTPNLLVKTFTL